MIHFWIPRTKIIEPKDAIQLPGIGIAGQMRAIRIGPDGKERWRGPWCKNLWTDVGLNYWLQSGVQGDYWYGRVGTGNAEPTPSDIALQSLVATSNNNGAFQTQNLVDPGGGQLFYGYDTFRYTFSPVGVSHNLTEFGTTWRGTTTMAVRSLFRDAGGAPTTVTWVAGETLLVDHQIRYYGSPADTVGTLTMGTSNIVHNLLLRANNIIGINAYNNYIINQQYPITIQGVSAFANPVFGTYAQNLTGTSLGAASPVQSAYTSNSFYREATVIWTPAQANNAAGIGAFAVSLSPGRHKVQFTPPIMKEDTDTLTMTFSTPTWSRYP